MTNAPHTSLLHTQNQEGQTEAVNGCFMCTVSRARRHAVALGTSTMLKTLYNTSYMYYIVRAMFDNEPGDSTVPEVSDAELFRGECVTPLGGEQ